RNTHGDFSRDLRERLEVFGWYRLLDPTGTVRLELASDRDGLRRREAPVHLDEYLAVGPDAFACGLDKVDRAAELGVSQLLPRGAEGVELDRTVALRERALRRVAALGGRALHRVPAVRVGGDPLAYRSPEEPIHGLNERLSHDVQARRPDQREVRPCVLH